MHSLRLAGSRAASLMARPAAPRMTASLHSSVARLALSKFNMPAMSPTMTEGGIAAWKKQPGETFAAGDVLLEIETDKATMDVEAQDDGIMAKIIVPEGSKNVQVNSVIAIIGEEGDDISGADALAAEAEKDAPAPAQAEEAAPEPKKEEKKEQEAAPPAPKKEESSSQASSTSSSSSGSSSGRVFASPLARKIAQEKGIPLAQVKGSGPNGRIVKADVEGYKAPAAAPAAEQPSKQAAAPSAPAKGAAAPTASSSSAPASTTPYTDVPVSSMRRVIAGRLTESKQNLPHYYVSIDVEMDNVLKLRQAFNDASEKRLAAAGADKAKIKEAKLSVGDFITKAAAVALREVPDVNAGWYGDFIRQYHQADISIAVATPTGLITPIVRNVGGSGLASISSQTKELASKARSGKLKPEEYQGGSFTISNMGMFGITHFTAIINPPQSAILAIGGTERKVLPAEDVVVDEETGETAESFRTAMVMQATISADHRTVDGATAAKWMKAFKDALENPLSFML